MKDESSPSIENDFHGYKNQPLNQFECNDIVQAANDKVQIRLAIGLIISIVCLQLTKLFNLGNHWIVFVIFGCWFLLMLFWVGPEFLKVIRYSKKVHGGEPQ